MQYGKMNVLIGNSFGSEGKGNIAAYLGKKHAEDLTICAYIGGPNSGHQFIDHKGDIKTVKMLPVSGILATKSIIVLTSGCIIDVDRLEEEIREFAEYGVSSRLIISPTAVIVDQYCKDYEKEHLQYISSTFQGTGAALGLKAMRSEKIKLAKDIPSLAKYVCVDIQDLIINNLTIDGTGLVEVSQGIHLSVDSQFYPYCTSRPVNVGQAIAYMDIPHSLIGDIIGITRSYFIRVGSVAGGSSGPMFQDSVELSWEEISKRIGRKVMELTTVTKRVRRVFEFSKIGFELGVKRNGINIVFLTFADYLNDDEKFEMETYLKTCGFKEIYMVSGFGDFENNIKKVQ